MNLAGLPAQISPSGTSRATTLPAPIIDFSPIVTPFSIMLCAPIKALSFMVTGNIFLFEISVPSYLSFQFNYENPYQKSWFLHQCSHKSQSLHFHGIVSQHWSFLYDHQFRV